MVRSLLLCCAILGCAKAEEPPATGSSSGRPAAEVAKEQAQFDAERKPGEIVKALGLRPGSRVADIGAGSGLLTVHLARAVQPTGKVVATDIEQEVLNIMEGRLRAAGLLDYVEPRVVEADKPGLGDEPVFDAILLAEVDHYFTDAAAWLAEAKRALKPGGRLVISNRIYRRDKSLEAAAKAKLVLQEARSSVSSHFIAVFTVESK